MMRSVIALTIGLVVGTVALAGAGATEATAAPDALVAITTGALRPTLTTLNPGEQVTWINASGFPVVRVVFDTVAGARDMRGFFPSSVTLPFSRPGVYPYTAFVGGKALPLRGKIVVK